MGAQGNVSVDFIDVLFALVVGEILTPLRNPSLIAPAGAAHLAVAATLTLMSWVGYHNSSSRSTKNLTPFNSAYWQFALDIVMVVVYWIASVSYEKRLPLPDGTAVFDPKSWWIFGAPSAIPETACVALSFLLYVIWDRIAKAERAKSHPAPDAEASTRMRRRAVSIWGLFGSLLLAAAAAILWWTTAPAVTVYPVDLATIGLLVAYRLYKEPTRSIPSRMIRSWM